MGKCTCKKTKDPNGNCDGSHNNKSNGEYSYSSRHRMYETIRKNKQGFMGSKTRVHEDRKAKHLKKIHQDEIDNRDEI